MNSKPHTAYDLNAGAGGSALGWEQAGFAVTAIDNDEDCCQTLRSNRPCWSVQRAEIRGLTSGLAGHADVVSALVTCPPMTAKEGFEDLIPDVALAAAELEARAVLVTTAPAPASPRYLPYRRDTEAMLSGLGYSAAAWSLVDANDFGVPQHRLTCVIVALRTDLLRWWLEPKPRPGRAPTVAQRLSESMDQRGIDRQHAERWARTADRTAPTITVPPRGHALDLGPSRAKRAWAAIGIDPGGIAADTDPVTQAGPNGRGPQLTVGQLALLQGMPTGWAFSGDTNARTRQAAALSNPQVVHAYAAQIRAVLRAADAHGS